MTDAKQALAEQLSALREEFRRSVPGRLAEIEHDFATLMARPDAAALTALRASTHRLAGAAGTFGMAPLGAVASAMEILTQSMISGAGPDERTARAELQTQLARLRTLAAMNPPPAPVARAFPAPKAAGTRRVFVVDDEIEVGREIAASIAQYGYLATVFERPAEMLTALRNDPPSALVLDLTFPEGLLDIAMIEEARRIAAIPVLLISARGDLQARLHAVRGHCDGYLTKPIDIGALVDRLDRLMQVPELVPWRVLVVDDDLLFGQSCAAVLSGAGIAVEVLTDPGTLLERMNELHPDLIVMDMYLPDCRGDELAAVIRQFDAWQGIPIVYLSAETDRHRQLRGLESGGDDFLTKPISDDDLRRTVIARIRRTQRLRAMMTRDGLTGLLNHVRFLDQLGIEVARARRDRQDLSVAMIDIDHFKQVNDQYGHAAGDAVIKSVARLLLQRLRRVDVIGRYGGEEFAVALPDTGLADAIRLLDDVRQLFAEQRFGRLDGDFGVTFSVGVAALDPTTDPRQLIDRADQALYRAKRGGRNQVVAAGPEAS